MSEALDQGIADRLEQQLRRLEEVREGLLKEGRDAMLAIRRAIASVHAGDGRRAAELIREAEAILRRMKERAEGDMVRYVLPIESEYVEANAFYDVAFGQRIRGPEELGVDPRSYVLGLLDAVGECRRLIYDRVREGRLDEAGRLLRAMEDVYSKVAHMAIYDGVAPGIKRKVDVAKIVLDDGARIMTEASMRCGKG